MIPILARAVGAPCPTLVLDARTLPTGATALARALAEARAELVAAGLAEVLKIALVAPSAHPMFDLAYRFVQVLPGVPGRPDRFDLGGSCGHSILCSVVAAERSGMLPPLSVGSRVRVDVRNNGDRVVCEVDRAGRDGLELTAHFVRPEPVPPRELLLTGRPLTALTVPGEPRPLLVSLVSSGNAYAFVDARALGIVGPEQLFGAGDELFGRLCRIREQAALRLGRDPEGAFPKIAALLPLADGRLAARAVTVPRWHPTLALTGAICLGTAVRIPGTVPARLAAEAGCGDGPIGIRTPGGATTVRAAVTEHRGEPALTWASVSEKRVDHLGPLSTEPLALPSFEEAARCLELSKLPA